jgi:hypothetical protein
VHNAIPQSVSSAGKISDAVRNSSDDSVSYRFLPAIPLSGTDFARNIRDEPSEVL